MRHSYMKCFWKNNSNNHHLNSLQIFIMDNSYQFVVCCMETSPVLIVLCYVCMYELYREKWIESPFIKLFTHLSLIVTTLMYIRFVVVMLLLHTVLLIIFVYAINKNVGAHRYVCVYVYFKICSYSFT